MLGLVLESILEAKNGPKHLGIRVGPDHIAEMVREGLWGSGTDRQDCLGTDFDLAGPSQLFLVQVELQVHAPYDSLC